MERDFGPEEVDENMGDKDFANDFAEALGDALDELMELSKKLEVNASKESTPWMMSFLKSTSSTNQRLANNDKFT